MTLDYNALPNRRRLLAQRRQKQSMQWYKDNFRHQSREQKLKKLHGKNKQLMVKFAIANAAIVDAWMFMWSKMKLLFAAEHWPVIVEPHFFRAVHLLPGFRSHYGALCNCLHHSISTLSTDPNAHAFSLKPLMMRNQVSIGNTLENIIECPRREKNW